MSIGSAQDGEPNHKDGGLARLCGLARVCWLYRSAALRSGLAAGVMVRIIHSRGGLST